MSERFDFQNPRPLPDDMPLKADLSPVDIAFSTAKGHIHRGGAYLSYQDGQCRLVDRKWKDIASKLFFSGGSFDQLGLRVRKDLDGRLVIANIKWLLSSFDPKHEEKEATVGFAISKWFEPANAQSEAA